MKSIFVSSTFKDMHEERDILHQRVMPALNEYAARYGESVSFCDLRWGVNTEDLDSEEGSRKVLSVCLDEIDRCRPYMLVLLGERYGWIPDARTMNEAEEGREGIDMRDMEKSVTALEIEYGSLRDKERLGHTLFYFREFEGPAPERFGGEDEFHRARLADLKERIRNLAGENVHTYKVSWDARNHTLKGLDAFAGQVEADVKAIMAEEWKSAARLTPRQRDEKFQWNYARQKAEQFRAREYLAEEYENTLRQGERLLLVTGAAGSGKTTLVARLAVKLAKDGKEVLPLFCGTTMFCNDALDLVRYIVGHIEDKFSLEHYEGRREGWLSRLEQMCDLYAKRSETQLIVIVDAVDQLYADDLRDMLRFIPPNLSDKVKMVCSYLNTFHPGYHGGQRLMKTLAPMEEPERREAVEGILHAAARELPDVVADRIIAKEGAGNPLYLSLAVQRLVMMDRADFEKIAARGDGIHAITAYQTEMVEQLPDTLDALCVSIIHAAAGKVGGKPAEGMVRYIAVSRHGLREKDLEGIFAVQNMAWNSLDFTLFVRYIKSFFMLRDDGRWDFTHRSIREGLLRNCLDVKALHREVLAHLKRLVPEDAVRLEEIIYHCVMADDKEYFVQYINQYEYIVDAVRPAARTVYEAVLQDKGAWLCEVLAGGQKYGMDSRMIYFLCLDLKSCMGTSEKELLVQKKIFGAALDFAQRAALGDGAALSWREVRLCQESLADVYRLLGGEENLEEAWKLCGRALELAEEAAKEDRSERNLDTLAVSLVHAGDVLKTRGSRKDLLKAAQFYEEAADICQGLAQKEESRRFSHNLCTSWERAGDVYLMLGGKENLEKAAKLHERSLQAAREQAREESTFENRWILAIGCEKAGDAYWRQGGADNLQKARQKYEESLAIRKELSKERQTPEIWRVLRISYERLGTVLASLGGEDFERARGMFEKSLALSKELAEGNQTSESQRNLGAGYADLAEWFRTRGKEGDLERAREMYEKGLVLFENLEKEKQTVESRRDLANICDRLGDICLSLGGEENLIRSRELYERSLSARADSDMEEKTALTREQLAASLYKAAVHPLTAPDVRTDYLKMMANISLELYRETGNEKYMRFVVLAKTALEEKK